VGQVSDLAIIAGRIISCGKVRDETFLGNTLFLREMNGLASRTSSRPTKLVHCGLRYLKCYGSAYRTPAEHQLLKARAQT
jgi:glycerol-3-phosphate dehydrogenase